MTEQLDCHAIEPKLSAWVDGQLTERQADLVRTHLAQCPGCWGELQALETVRQRLSTLKTPAGASPAGLTAAVRALPAWLVRLAVVRRWIAGGAAMAGVVAAVAFALYVSEPLPATLVAGTTQDTKPLAAGTTLIANDGEMIRLALDGGGTIQLQGPGSLIVRRAEEGRIQKDQRLALNLPSGMVTIQFGSRAPAHDIQLMTPQASVHLTGTWVVVQATPLTTEVDVLDGRAQVQNLATAETARLGVGQVAKIEAGEMEIGRIPMEEWLSRKGLTSSQRSAPEDAPSTEAPHRHLSFEHR